MANKVFLFRIYPSKEQMQLIWCIIGACRFVWNQALGWKNAAYAADKTSLTAGDLSYGLTKSKKFYPWLKEADSVALQQSLRHLNTAFENFYKKRTGYPKFKARKSSKWSYTTVPNNNKVPNVRIENGALVLPKIGKIKSIITKEIPAEWKLKSVTITVERDWTVFASCCFEYEEAQQMNVWNLENAIGLDYKSDGLYMDSNGYVCGSPKYFRKGQDRLKRQQRKLRHKKPGSSNYEKQKRKIARCRRHESNQRKDFLHKRSTEIANQYDIVCVETLNLRNMANKGFGNGKATLDNGYGMFLNMLEYKLADRGRILIKVDRFFASSQICNCCKRKNPEVKDLKIRSWVCPTCGSKNDRDLNAAKNILEEGLRKLKGENVA